MVNTARNVNTSTVGEGPSKWPPRTVIHTVCVEVGAALGKLVQALDGDTVCLHHDKLRKNLQNIISINK